MKYKFGNKTYNLTFSGLFATKTNSAQLKGEFDSNDKIGAQLESLKAAGWCFSTDATTPNHQYRRVFYDDKGRVLIEPRSIVVQWKPDADPDHTPLTLVNQVQKNNCSFVREFGFAKCLYEIQVFDNQYAISTAVEFQMNPDCIFAEPSFIRLFKDC